MENKNNRGQDEQSKRSFLLYHDFHEQISVLSDEDAGILIKAIFEYEITGICPEIPLLVKAVFIPIRQILDRNAKRYGERVEINRINGHLGGRPKTEGSQTERFSENSKITEGFSEKAKKPDKDNGNDKDNEKEKTKDLPPSGASHPSEANESPSISESEKAEPKPKPQPQQGKSDRYSAEFEQFWKTYPKRNGKRGSKDGAFVNWTRLLQGKRELFGMPMPTEAQLMQAARSYATHCSGNSQFPQDAQTWLGADNHWKEFLPNQANQLNQTGESGLDLESYCKLPDGSIDMKKMLCVKRALDGDPNYAEYLPTATKTI